MVNALRDATVTLCLDTNGNHVVQRLLQHLDPSANAFVFEVTPCSLFAFFLARARGLPPSIFVLTFVMSRKDHSGYSSALAGDKSLLGL